MTATKIPRDLWRDIKSEQPRFEDICLVSDGDDVTVAIWRGATYEKWAPACVYGDHGYGTSLAFNPTHWMPLNVELPA